MPHDISDSSSTNTKATLHVVSPLTTKVQVPVTGARNTSPGSLTSTLQEDLKNGQITPEQAIEKAFPSPFTHVSDISVDALKITPLKTGFRTLDQHLVLKKHRPELVVVGAGTSHGKSAFMLQVAANVSHQGPVFVYSLEMDERDIKARLLAPRISQPLNRIMSGELSPKKLAEANDSFKAMNLHICTNGRREVSYIQSSCYEMANKVGLPSLIVVDYLQLLRGPVRNMRTSEIAEILGVLKGLAKEMKCPVLIGSQLNRNCERRGKQSENEKGTGMGDYMPIKADLMDSGSIEHDADVIMFISRQYVYDRTRPNEADFVIAKNRNGQLWTGIMQFTGELCCFLERESL